MASGPLLHVDADAFFASVVLRSRPDLVSVPMAVVAHVFIASANYPARARGIRSGVLATEAVRHVPELVLVDVPRDEVEATSDALFDLFHGSARAVEPGSVEEAFLDVGARDWSSAVEAGHRLRRLVAAELGIPVSVGVGRTKLMAKLASRAAKPDGLRVIDSEAEADLRANLAIADVWGIGPVTRRRLEDLGVARLFEIDRVPRATLRDVCGTSMAQRLWAIRECTDDAVVRPVEHRASLSAQGSVSGYARPDWTVPELVGLCVRRVCRRASRAGLTAAAMSVQLQTPTTRDDVTVRRATATPTSDGEAWLRDIEELWKGQPVPGVIGIKVTLSGLRLASGTPPTLFG